jgi:D-alanyl-D-alanine carboxypeptidase
MFTATLLLQLAGEGEVELSAPVQRYLPGVLPPSYPPIPVESLLDHTSGLPTSDEDAGHEDPAYFVAHRFDSFTPHQVIATATDDSMSFPPGTAQQYNGVNYFLAGLVIEAATGHSYARELKQRILRPLRLGDTLLPDAEDPTIPGAHAHSYLRVQDAPVDITLQSPYGWAESGIISTTADQQRFLRALLEGRILKRAEQRHLFGVPDLPYAGDDCGPSARACYSSGLTRTVLPGGVVVWGKSGSLPGTSSGAFGTRDGSPLLTYALHPLGNRDGSEGPVLQGIVTAAFGLR